MAVGRVVGGIAGLGLVGAGYLGLAGEDNTSRNEQGEIVEGGELGAFRIRLGDCLAGAPEGVIESVQGVPCEEPHDSEVYHAFMLPDGPFPGEDAVFALVDEGCYAAFAPFVGHDYETSVFDFGAIYPSSESWTAVDDREVLCTIAHFDGTPKTGSARDAGR